MASPRAVLFDWRGTLAAYLSDRDWVRLALSRAGRSYDDRAVAAVLDALRFKTNVLWSQLDALYHAYYDPGMIPPGAFVPGGADG